MPRWLQLLLGLTCVVVLSVVAWPRLNRLREPGDLALLKARNSLVGVEALQDASGPPYKSRIELLKMLPVLSSERREMEGVTVDLLNHGQDYMAVVHLPEHQIECITASRPLRELRGADIVLDAKLRWGHWGDGSYSTLCRRYGDAWKALSAIHLAEGVLYNSEDVERLRSEYRDRLTERLTGLGLR